MSTTTVIETVDVNSQKKASTSKRGGMLGGVSLLLRRRLWRDRVIVVASMLVVALSTFLTYVAPEAVTRTVDRGVRDAITSAQDTTAITANFALGNTESDGTTSVPGSDPHELDEAAQDIRANLPKPIAAIALETEAWAISKNAVVEATLDPTLAAQYFAERESPVMIDEPLRWPVAPLWEVQIALADDAEVRVIDGVGPAAPPAPADQGDDRASRGNTRNNYVFRQEIDEDGTPLLNEDGTPLLARVAVPFVIEVGVTPAVAEAMALEVGTLVRIGNGTGNTVVLHVTAIVEPADANAAMWTRLPEATTPLRRTTVTGNEYTRGTIVVSAAAAVAITNGLQAPMTAYVVTPVSGDNLTLRSSRAVARAANEIVSDPSVVIDTRSATNRLSTDLGEVLDSYPPRARAATAQMSIMVAGISAVASMVIALMARLLLSRRERDIALERARGASIPSIGLRLFLESALVSAAGGIGGFYASRYFVGPELKVSGLAWVVMIIAAVASPILGVMMARRTWTGRREAANRQDRAKVAKALRARRLVLEVLALILAVLAVITLRGRGVLQTQTSGLDPFLAAAPVLVALGVTVIVLRVFPLPMKVIQFFARRTRGVAGVITLAKAREKLPILPLLALTMAVAIAVSGGLLVGTIRDGQVQGSWERIGGDVRVDAAPADTIPALTALEDAGLSVADLIHKPATLLQLDGGYASVNLLAVDEEFVSAIEAAGFADASDLRAMLDATANLAPTDPIPVLAPKDVSVLDFGEESELLINNLWAPITIVGEPTYSPAGWLEGETFVYVSSEALMGLTTEIPVVANIWIVNGPGAADAVGALELDPEAVQSRDAWLENARGSALIGGVEEIFAWAVVAVGVFAAIAIVIAVLEGVRERGKALSMLRTQGMGPRYGWWLALSELTPLVVAAVVGGAAAGYAILRLLGQNLGLEVLSGGITVPPLVADPTFLGIVAGGVVALLLAAVTAEVLVHRRHKLADVLRSGESR